MRNYIGGVQVESQEKEGVVEKEVKERNSSKWE